MKNKTDSHPTPENLIEEFPQTDEIHRCVEMKLVIRSLREQLSTVSAERDEALKKVEIRDATINQMLETQGDIIP